METIRTLKLEPGKTAVECYLGNDLKSMQKAVGGLIEFCWPPELGEINGTILCNEEGKIDRLPISRPLIDDDGEFYDFIAGTCYIMIDDNCGGCKSLSNEDIQYIKDNTHLWYSGVPIKIGGEFHWIADKG